VSKFTLKDPAGEGDQNSLTRDEGDFHAAAWSREVLLIELARVEMSGMVPS
jgi:hypothetical protein